MIRRETDDAYLLITQHDHAIAAGALARRVGNTLFSVPTPLDGVIDGILLHDAGWPLHDDAPTLNPQGQPLHVFEVPVPIAATVWSESVSRATAQSDYAGLLVSVHVLHLSALLFSHHASELSRSQAFELNKFQHRQIETQDALRKRLGLPTDVPLRLGLAETIDAPPAPRDLELIRNYRLLSLMDRFSLSLCTGRNLFPDVEDAIPRPGQPPLPMRLRMPDPATLVVTPWPFDQAEITLNVPARRLPKRPFASVEDFRTAYQAAPSEPLRLTITCQ